MHELPLLESLGLSPSESRIYLALLAEGASSIRKLADVAKVNRGTTYESLKRLTSFGLVSFVQKGERRKYIAERPDKILDVISEKQRELDRLRVQATELVPTLLATSQRFQGEPLVRFYEDDEGIVAILRDVLATTAKLPPHAYFVYSSRSMRSYIYRRFPNFTKQRIAAGIYVQVIAVGEGGEPDTLSDRKWVPEPRYEQLSSYTIIYGDKVATISVSGDDTPYGVIVEEPGVAAMQKHLFTQLWDRLN